MLRIEFDIFSGRPNPSWVLEGDAARAVLDRISDLPALAADAAPLPRLGFRGIKLRLAEPLARERDLPTKFRIASGPEADERSVALALALVDELVRDEELRQLIRADIARFAEEAPGLLAARNRGAPPAKPNKAVTYPPATYDALPYNPQAWNANPAVLENNNCYAYATNKPTNSFPQPGRYHGYRLTRAALADCAAVGRYSNIDGLLAGATDVSPAQAPRLYVALVVAPYIDYHWYRLVEDPTDGSLYWGHKPGSTPVINTDNSGNIITDPQTANRGIYTLFCQYMLAPMSCVTVV